MEAKAVAVLAVVGMAPEEVFLHPMEDVKYSSITFVIYPPLLPFPPSGKVSYMVDLIGLVAIQRWLARSQGLVSSSRYVAISS